MKKVVICICLVMFGFGAVNAVAQQNKVVVVPLGGASASKTAAAFAGEDLQVELTDTPAVMSSVTITVETEGIILVNASCYVWLRGFVDYDSAGISISETTGMDLKNTHVASGSVNPAADVDDRGSYRSVSLTGGFNVTPGTYTYYLNAVKYYGTVFLRDPHINALFVPAP
ncbi:MAG: hypothetical protein ACWGN1_02600 [Desulfobulbales bacterium]